MRGSGRSTYALLSRHFLKQFLENDLIAPDADRTQLLAVVGAMAFCLTLFASVFLSFNYVIAQFTPGQTAMLSLDDKFFYVALSMLATALTAAAQWDALAIDPRDAAILEPLPVRAGTIRRAKMSAVALLGASVAIAVNFVPSLVFSWALVYRYRGIAMFTMIGMMIAHFVTTIAAGAFGYLVVIAIREWATALLGLRWFRRVSPWLQGGLIVALGTMLLLMPGASHRLAQRGFDGWRVNSPPMWFVGAYESRVGSIIADLPRGRLSPRQVNADRIATDLYESRRDRFAPLARQAWIAFGLVALLAAAGYLWNARRWPSLGAAAPPSTRRAWKWIDTLAGALLSRHPAARAGFFFTMAAMWRSSTHRLTLACAAAAGIAMAIVALSGVNFQQQAASARFFSMQPLLFGALLIGFRHIIRVPAELRANWGFQLAWRGHDRAFISGAKSAAMMGLALPAIALLLPLFIWAMGTPNALQHAALGLAGAIVCLEAMLITFDKVPFTCSYLPSENMKALGPIYAGLFLIVATLFARLEYAAIVQGRWPFAILTLLAIDVAIRVATRVRRRPPTVDFDEAPAASFSRLSLDS